MKISQPFVLLLGGLLSASSIGCSAVSAVVHDSRPAPHDSREGSADRMVAIGRVFENQGRFDSAEVMYRRALKQNPRNPVVRDQLQQLANRRKSREFTADPASTAIALADSVSARDNTAGRAVLPATAVTATQTKAVAERQPTAAVSPRVVPTAAEAQERPQVEYAAVAAMATDAAPVTVAATELSVEGPPVPDSGRSSELADTVTAEEILAVIDEAADHSELLIRGLQVGDSWETKCLAATLLGDCAPDNSKVRDMLADGAPANADDGLRLAIATSRIQRGEADVSTARSLISLLESGAEDTRIQAAAELRHFGGTEAHEDCVLALRHLLATDSENLRAIAAVTLGDFPHIDPETSSQLRKLSTDDDSSQVREAASAAVGRARRPDAGTAQAMVVSPR